MKIQVAGQSLQHVQDKEIVRVVLSSEKHTQILVSPDSRKTLSVGIGEKEKMNRRKLINLIRKIIVSAKTNEIKRIAVSFDDFNFEHLRLTEHDLAELMAVNFEMANFEYTKYKTQKEGENINVEDVLICGRDSDVVKAAVEKGRKVGQEVNACRELSNTPGGDMTPELLASHACNVAGSVPLKVHILGLKEIEDLGMGGLLGVSRGSMSEPRMIVLEYMPNGDEKPIVLVGKGITFDTGGLSLKPADYMGGMHMDMSGGAAVIHTLAVAAKLGLKKNVVGIIPAAENMPSGESYRPGDILKSMSGLTIEVLNTDAEGRIILADALTYAKKYNPRLVVDVATLTGAVMVALGKRASAIYTKDSELEKLSLELGEESGDFLWPMPLWEEYEEDIKGTFGDWANNGKDRYGGSITAAMFLYQFAKDYPWMHIDIASRMTSVDGEYLAKGAAGAPVRFLVKLLERY